MADSTLKNAYAELYDSCGGENGLANKSCFVAMKGSKYPTVSSNNSCRFLLIGRSANSWSLGPATTSREVFCEEAKNIFNEYNFDKWVDFTNGHAVARDAEKKSRSYYLSTPFWSYTKRIWANLANLDENKASTDWVQNIAWSNLYKVSPNTGGNPCNTLCSEQLKASKKILEAELECLNPTHVLLLTGYNWVVWEGHEEDGFETAFSRRPVFNVSFHDGPAYVEGIARYKDAKVVIACRPEGRNKDNYVKAVLEAFQ